MKKTFPLQAPGKDDARVLDAIKSDVRKYVKRERRKTLPPGFEVWQLDCRVGAEPATAVVTPLPDLSAAIDAAAKGGGPGLYVEILASPTHRTPAAAPSSVAPTPPQ